jgi:hypothetical protein
LSAECAQRTLGTPDAYGRGSYAREPRSPASPPSESVRARDRASPPQSLLKHGPARLCSVACHVCIVSPSLLAGHLHPGWLVRSEGGISLHTMNDLGRPRVPVTPQARERYTWCYPSNIVYAHTVDWGVGSREVSSKLSSPIDHVSSLAVDGDERLARALWPARARLAHASGLFAHGHPARRAASRTHEVHARRTCMSWRCCRSAA